MARFKRASRKQKGTAPGTKSPASPARSGEPTGPGGLPLPSPVAGTNLVIADIVLRAAGGLLRDRMERGLLNKSYSKAAADSLVDGRGLATNIALWGASHLARRSPVGLALVAGGLAAKVFYDRGKRLEAKRRAGKSTDSKS